MDGWGDSAPGDPNGYGDSFNGFFNFAPTPAIDPIQQLYQDVASGTVKLSPTEFDRLLTNQDRGMGSWEFALYLAYPVLFVGLLLDLLVNVFVFTIILIEIPEELTVTARLKRHGKQGGWRGDFSRWFCESLLDTFDPSGDHC